MVVKRSCSFCAREIEPGTGTMFVKRDGTVFHFCSSSCRKQQLHLGRVGHRFKWTRAHELKRAADRSTAQKAPTPAASPSKKGGAVRPGARRPVAPASAVAPSAPVVPATPVAPNEAAPAPAETKDVAKAAEKTAPATKPRRPRKKAESAPSEE